MSFTFALILIAFLGLGAALWALLRGFGLDLERYRRRQVKVALSLLGLLAGLGLLQAAYEYRIVERLTAPEVDGIWAAVSIDGRPVSGQEWRITVSRGKVSGGRDGCNDWGFDGPEVQGGERMIVTTLAECPEDDPVRKGYWRLALAERPSLDLRKDGTLRVRAAGHDSVLRRCRWASEPLPPGASGAGPRVCTVEDRGGNSN